MSKEKYILLKITTKEFESIIDIADDISAMRGSDFETSAIWAKAIKNVDKALKRNGYKRKFT